MAAGESRPNARRHLLQDEGGPSAPIFTRRDGWSLDGLVADLSGSGGGGPASPSPPPPPQLARQSLSSAQPAQPVQAAQRSVASAAVLSTTASPPQSGSPPLPPAAAVSPRASPPLPLQEASRFGLRREGVDADLSAFLGGPHDDAADVLPSAEPVDSARTSTDLVTLYLPRAGVALADPLAAPGATLLPHRQEPVSLLSSLVPRDRTERLPRAVASSPARRRLPATPATSTPSAVSAASAVLLASDQHALPAAVRLDLRLSVAAAAQSTTAATVAAAPGEPRSLVGTTTTATSTATAVVDDVPSARAVRALSGRLGMDTRRRSGGARDGPGSDAGNHTSDDDDDDDAFVRTRAAMRPSAAQVLRPSRTFSGGEAKR